MESKKQFFPALLGESYAARHLCRGTLLTILLLAVLIVLILLLGSMQLFCIGIIGEYVGKIFEQSKVRPIYIAKEVLAPKD